MENAAQALLMAGSILIAIMVIGALMLMLNNLSNYQSANIDNQRDVQIIEFNNQFETYNRTDVRGSDIVSLLNRAVDYNTRKSSAGVGKEGEKIAFMPIEITVTMTTNDFQNLSSIAGQNPQLMQNTYKADGMVNNFNNTYSSIRNIEGIYGQTSLTALVTGLDRIFIKDSSTKEERDLAVIAFNTSSKTKKANGWNDISENSQYRNP